jgi:hypothetical protein
MTELGILVEDELTYVGTNPESVTCTERRLADVLVQRWRFQFKRIILFEPPNSLSAQLFSATKGRDRWSMAPLVWVGGRPQGLGVLVRKYKWAVRYVASGGEEEGGFHLDLDSRDQLRFAFSGRLADGVMDLCKEILEQCPHVVVYNDVIFNEQHHLKLLPSCLRTLHLNESPPTAAYGTSDFLPTTSNQFPVWNAWIDYAVERNIRAFESVRQRAETLVLLLVSFGFNKTLACRAVYEAVCKQHVRVFMGEQIDEVEAAYDLEEYAKRRKNGSHMFVEAGMEKTRDGETQESEIPIEFFADVMTWFKVHE